MEQQGDLLRRLLGSGHAVGLTVDAGAEEPLEQQLQSGNEQLQRATCTKSRLVWLRNSTGQAVREVNELGYQCLQPRINRDTSGLKASTQANTVLKRVESLRGDISIWLGGNVESVGLRTLLAGARAGDDRCLALTEQDAA